MDTFVNLQKQYQKVLNWTADRNALGKNDAKQMIVKFEGGIFIQSTILTLTGIKDKKRTVSIYELLQLSNYLYVGILYKYVSATIKFLIWLHCQIYLSFC